VESAIFLFTRRVLAYFRVNPSKRFNQPVFLSGAPVLIHRRVNLGLTRGNRKGVGRKQSKNRRVLFSRYLAANDGQISRVNPGVSTGVASFDGDLLIGIF